MGTKHRGSVAERRALDLYIKVMRAANALADRAFNTADHEGLTPTQFGVLEALLHLGPLMPSQIAAKQLQSRNNVTSVLDALERSGYVERRRCPDDRRSIWVHLTPGGDSLIRRVFPRHLRAIVEAVSALTPHEQEAAGGLLRKLGRAGM